MIKIIQGVYGHMVDGRVYPKNSTSEPFELSEAQEARLVGLGVAVYVDGGSSALPEGGDGAPLYYSVDMKADELRAIAKDMGLTFKVGMSKAEMVEAMDAHIKASIEENEADTDTTEEAEDDGEELPEFDAAEAVE